MTQIMDHNIFIFKLTKVVFGILGLLEVHKIPSILTQKAIKDREDSKHSNEDNASDEDRVGDL